jgi:hypothetical protein
MQGKGPGSCQHGSPPGVARGWWQHRQLPHTSCHPRGALRKCSWQSSACPATAPHHKLAAPEAAAEAAACAAQPGQLSCCCCWLRACGPPAPALLCVSSSTRARCRPIRKRQAQLQLSARLAGARCERAWQQRQLPSCGCCIPAQVLAAHAASAPKLPPPCSTAHRLLKRRRVQLPRALPSEVRPLSCCQGCVRAWHQQQHRCVSAAPKRAAGQRQAGRRCRTSGRCQQQRGQGLLRLPGPLIGGSWHAGAARGTGRGLQER